jgi:hypothetical protein
LRTSRCFDLIVWEIFSLKSLSPDRLRATSPSGTFNLLRKIRIVAGQTITIPDETMSREFFFETRMLLS